MLHSLQRRARTSTYSTTKQEIAPRKRVLDEIRESVENSTNSSNLLQLEKSLNSAYSFFFLYYRRERFFTQVSTTINNAPSNKLRRNNQGLFGQRESMTE